MLAATLALLVLSPTPVAREPRIIGVILKTTGPVTLHVADHQPPKRPVNYQLFAGDSLDIPAKVTAFVFNFRHVKAVTGPAVWPNVDEIGRSLSLKLTARLQQTKDEQKNYIATGLRGNEPILQRPIGIASRLLPSTTGSKFLLLYASSLDHVTELKITPDSGAVITKSEPKLVHIYSRNAVYSIEVTVESGKPRLAIDWRYIRGEWIDLNTTPLPGEDSFGDADSFDAALALAGAYNLAERSADSILAAYSALDLAKTNEQKAEANEELWVLFSLLGSPLADAHAPPKDKQTIKALTGESALQEGGLKG